MILAGLDPASQRDYFGAVFIERLPDHLRILGAHRPPHGPWEQQTDDIARLLLHYKAERAIIDGTGVGSAAMELLRRKTLVPLLPITFSAKQKRQLFEGLIELVQSGRLQAAPGMPGSAELQDELRRLTSTSTRTGNCYSGKATGHDDLAVALALACHGARLDPQAYAHHQ